MYGKLIIGSWNMKTVTGWIRELAGGGDKVLFVYKKQNEKGMTGRKRSGMDINCCILEREEEGIG